MGIRVSGLREKKDKSQLRVVCRIKFGGFFGFGGSFRAWELRERVSESPTAKMFKKKINK